MAVDLLQLAPQFALVIIFMWFVLELGKRSDKATQDLDIRSSDTLQKQNERYMEALSLQNDQYKAALNEMNKHYLEAMDIQSKHFQEALAWRDNMLNEQRKADREAMKEIVVEISRMALILERHDKETSDAISAMYERARVLENREIERRLPKTNE